MAAFAVCLAASGSQAVADVWLPRIFADGMVLQRGASTPVYGRADANEALSIRLVDREGKVVQQRFGKTNPKGEWRIEFRNLRAGGPYRLEVSGAGSRRSFENVLVGEVWVCSGQSNMEWAADWFQGRRFEIGEAELPQLRLLTVQHQVAPEPRDDAPMLTWQPSSERLARQFSLVGFLYGRELHKKLGVPVGLIHSSWGGTPAESWTSLATLRTRPEFAAIVDRYESSMRDYPKALERYAREMQEWQKRIFGLESGNDGASLGWQNPSHDDADWKPISLPSWFEAGRDPYDGATWVRKVFHLPADRQMRDMVLELGSIDDHDTTFVNGVKVGEIGPETPNAYAQARRYRVPKNLLKAGPNVIAVRVFDMLGQGGFGGPADAMRIYDDELKISLSGEWKMKVERVLTESDRTEAGGMPRPPATLDNPWLPSSLYNGMIMPVAPYGIRGVIWYQGESNADRAVQYRTLFPAMIEDWRRVFRNPRMPFYFVQLANFMDPQTGPEESAWAELREAQAMTLRLPFTGMALAIDAGEATDIHPIRKDIVAERLARLALARTYGQRVVDSGPVYAGMHIEGNRVRLSLKHANGLRTRDGEAPSSFQVAGADRKWHMARAKVDGDAIVVWHPDVKAPVAVRHAWANNPHVNVVNAEGLPLAPFRTDRWPETTREKN